MSKEMRKQIDNFKNFSNKKLNETYQPSEYNINQHIEQSSDIEYLREIEKYVDMDIENIGKDSDVIKKMKAKMRNLSIEEMEKQQREGFLNLKRKIQNKISELGG